MAKVRVRVLKRKVYEWKSVQSPCKHSDTNIYVCVRVCVCVHGWSYKCRGSKLVYTREGESKRKEEERVGKKRGGKKDSELGVCGG